MLLLAVLVGAFALHAHRAAHPTADYQSADERAYGTLAISLAEDGHYGDSRSGLGDPHHWPPGAPALFAIGHEFFPNAASARTQNLPSAYWLQAVVSIGTVLATFGIAAALAGAWAGLLAAALAGFYPPLILATGEQLSEPLGAFLLTAAVSALALAATGRRAIGYPIAGVLAGLAVLTRADLVLAPFLIAGVTALWLWRSDGSGRLALRVGGALAGGALLVIVPWLAYASLRAGELIPVTRGAGSALFVGTYLPGDGTIVGMKRELGAEARGLDARLRQTPDLELPAADVLDVVAARHPAMERGDAIAREARRNLTRYALGQPIDFALMSLDKVQRMWSRYARGGGRHTHWAIRVWHIALVVAGLGGLAAGLWRAKQLVLGCILIVVGYSTVLHMVVISHARYNLPLMPLVIAGGVAGWSCWRDSSRSPGAA